jgi:glycerol-3-phosphate dehydrogenase subunit C
MATREGSLEAPKRHPIDWKNLDFYNETSLNQEMERVFDICHGCRRCVNLCTAFPRLFDLIDESTSGELDSVNKQQFWEVVDRCYLCDMCFMTKCPYVPPHEWNIDFPHLMLRAKAVKYKNQGAGFRDKLLSSTDLMGKLATIPVVVQAVNAMNNTPAVRKIMDSTLGIHADRKLPEYTADKFRANAKPNDTFPVKDGARTPSKVAIYATCYVNYNEPGIGHDLLKILEHNEIPARLVEKEACCGMPKLELGDLDAVEKLKNENIPHLLKLAQDGYAILSAVPSCTLMYKQELPLMFPHDAAVQAVAAAMFDPFEYLALRNQENLLKTDFKKPLGNVAYHIPCHQRVQNFGKKTRDILQLIPDTTVNTVERCSGHDGTWGVKSEHFADSMKIGRPVFKQMAASNPDYISSDCAIAARHIEQGIGESKAQKLHPLTLLRLAYDPDTPHKPAVSDDQPGSHTPSPGEKQMTTTLTRENLLTLEAYAKIRKDFRAQMMAHKKTRKVPLGENITLIFEDALTIRYQIQEMLHVERIFQEAEIIHELETYTPLIPDGHNWKATMMIEYADPVVRAAKLATLVGIEDKVWVKVAGHAPVFAIADEDLERENSEKTSSVHFLRFELTPAMIQALHQNAALSMGVDHPAYQAAIDPVAADVRASLLNDLATA